MPHKSAEDYRAYRKKYYAKNKEKQKAWQKKWNDKNKARMERYRKRWTKADRLAHPEKWKLREFRQTLRGHGTTVEWYEQQFKKQCGLCGICGKPETSTNKVNGEPMRLAVDHHHGRKQLRGLLCGKCNMSLARFENLEGWAELALEYLKKYET